MNTAPLFSEKEIQKMVQKIAQEISQFYGSQEILAIGILKGAFIFYAELLQHLQNASVVCDFCSVSYYGDSLKAAPEATIEMDISQTIKGKNVLIIDCIADRGHTLEFIKNHIQKRQPKSIKIAALITKPDARKKIQIDFSGFEVEQNVFVVGYGIDYRNQKRNLSHFEKVYVT